jgi:hypothetical protein
MPVLAIRVLVILFRRRILILDVVVLFMVLVLDGEYLTILHGNMLCQLAHQAKPLRLWLLIIVAIILTTVALLLGPSSVDSSFGVPSNYVSGMARLGLLTAALFLYSITALSLARLNIILVIRLPSNWQRAQWLLLVVSEVSVKRAQAL